MGRWRRHLTNAARQKAYRDRIRVTKNSAKPVTIPTQLLHWAEFIREMVDRGCSVDFLRRRFATQCRVIRAVLAMTPSKPRAEKTPEQRAEIMAMALEADRLRAIFGEAA